MHGRLYNQALTVVRSTGAGIRYLHCSFPSLFALLVTVVYSMEGQCGQKEHFLILINDFLILINDFLILINDFLILINGMIS